MKLKYICLKISIQFLFVFSAVIYAQQPKTQIHNLKVEAQAGWLVSDASMPRLSWEINSSSAQNKLAGYEVIISKQKSDAKNGIGSVWKSNVLVVNKGAWTLFDATHLASRTEAWWRVRPVFIDKSVGKWSEIGAFEVGLKNESDWKGKWIGMKPEDRKHSAPLFSKQFDVNKSILKARLYVCGLGYHESWLNGSKLGNEVLQPAQTDYDIRNFYVAHDITTQLKIGKNAIGFWVGDGFFNQDKVWGPKGLSYGEPRVIAQLEITYKDGSSSIITTDESWKCNVSAINESNIYAGEIFDARLYNSNWATKNVNLSNWKDVVILPNPGKVLVAQELQPCRKTAKIDAIKLTKLKSDTCIFDFGQNMVGWTKLKVNATAGTEIKIRFAESLLPNGELSFGSSGVVATNVIQTDIYTCKGGGEEIWEPRFTYHGFRFAELSILKGLLIQKVPTIDMLEGEVIHTDMEVIGDFSCSDSILNKAFKWAHWTQIGGVLGVPTDCPIRERCGWTGDAHNIVPYTLYRFNAATMWKKYTRDIVTSAQVSKPMAKFNKSMRDRVKAIKAVGIPTMVAPGKRFIGEATPDWGSALPFIPWDVYVRTGDIFLLSENYLSIKLWAEHLQGLSLDGIVSSGLGDWCKPLLDNPANGPGSHRFCEVTPMLSTACYYRSVRIAADAAKLLHKETEYLHFDSLANTIRIAFTKAFYSENRIMIPDQTINAIAIAWNVLDSELHPQVARVLAKQVEDAGFHFMTGVFGMPSLWPTLCKFGYQNIAWKALHVESAPSLMYNNKREATTFWEVWPLEKDENVEYKSSMSHPFHNGFVAWFFEGLAGISPDAKYPGYSKIHLEPQLLDGLDWVKCRFKSPMGMIESSWKRTDNKLVWTVEIPNGAISELRVPGRITKIVGAPIDIVSNASSVTDFMGNAQRILLESGKYEINSTIK
jgi:alpha-L-rhamnosidase